MFLFEPVWIFLGLRKKDACPEMVSEHARNPPVGAKFYLSVYKV